MSDDPILAALARLEACMATLRPGIYSAEEDGGMSGSSALQQVDAAGMALPTLVEVASKP